MYLTRFTNAEDFYKRAESFLLQHEVECNVIIGICTRLIRYPERILHHPYLAVVEMEGRVIAVAVRTPPYNLVLSVVEEEEALELIARDVYSVWKALPGVLGSKPVASEFVNIWHQLSGQPYHIAVQERLFRLDTVNPVNGIQGQMRRATVDDRPMLLEWVSAFIAEALPSDPNDPMMVVRQVDIALEFETNGYYLWEDGGQAVALAGYTGPTPHSIRIGPVYTPSQFRRKGYASALVSELSQMLLDSGRQFLTLYTDLANPTSNHIYQEIGYYPVIDVDQYLFNTSSPDAAEQG